VSDEQRLFGMLQQGDPTALRCLYERCKDDLLTVAGCLLGDRAAAEDCLHDVVVSFAAKAPEIRLRGTVKGYLVACVANRARDELRRRARHVSLSGAEEDWELPAAGADPAAAMEAYEETARLQKALAELPYEQREAITLHLHGELTFREIAQLHGISINTVQSRYRYGITRLKELLSPRLET
jgi:RNA polymerase sigma factor (sigma-70 family)